MLDDDPFAVLADRTLLEHYNCRSAAMFKHQAPDCEIEASRVELQHVPWAAGCLPQGARGSSSTPRRSTRTRWCARLSTRASPCRRLDKGARGADADQAAPTRSAHAARGAGLTPVRIHGLVVHAILGWPGCSRASTTPTRHGPQVRGERYVRVDCDRTAAQRGRAGGSDGTYQLAEAAGWLNAQLQAVGAVLNMVTARSARRAAKSFVKLAREVEIDPMYFYLSCKRDMQQKLRVEHRDAIRHSDQFATWCAT